MPISDHNEALSDTELDRLDEFLETREGGDAMNLEEMDGFFAALVAGPEVVMPSEYLPEVFGLEDEEGHVFDNLEHANDILGLITRHFNHIAATLASGDVYMPILLADEDGVEQGNDWASGFLEGTMFCHDDWVELMRDEDQGGCFLPMLALAYEGDEDGEEPPETLAPERRQDAIALMTVGLALAYRYFRDPARAAKRQARPSPRKIGRNDPCPCGSGKKYKRCCASASIQ